MQFDYDQLAKKLFEQFNGKIGSKNVESFTEENLAYSEQNKAPKTYEGDKLVTKHLLKFYSPIRELNTIDEKDAEKFLLHLKKNAPLGVYNYHRILKAMFNKAVEWNYIKTNPFLKLKLPRRQEKKPAFITQADLESVLEKITQPAIRDIVQISFYMGFRLGEATFLKWKNVSFNHNAITVGDESFSTKSRKSRSVPIHPKVKEIIERLKNENKNQKENFLFRKKGNQPFTRDYISKKFKKACRDAGIDESIHYHSLRHSTGSLLAQKGVSLYTIQKILGHSQPSVTQIYAHMQIDTLREAINQIN